MYNKEDISAIFASDQRIVVHEGDCLRLLSQVPSDSVQLVVTSPPYNIGKEYEKNLRLDTYLAQQERVIAECLRILSPRGSICWQVGNHVHDGAIVPLDAVLYPIFFQIGPENEEPNHLALRAWTPLQPKTFRPL